MRRRNVLSATGASLSVAAGMAGVAYFRIGNRSVVASAAFGLLVGVLFLVLQLAARRGRRIELELRGVPIFETLLIAAGSAVVLLGAGRSSLGTAAAGLPLILLGGGLLLAKRLAARSSRPKR